MACESWGCVGGLGGDRDVSSQVFGGSSSVLVLCGPDSCAEFLASEGSCVWNPCWARCLMPAVVLCHQPEVELMC